MNTRSKAVSALVLLSSVVSLNANAEIPNMIPYGGTVAIEGESYTGDGAFRFAIVNQACATASQGCVTLWSNDGKSVAGGAPATSVQLPVADGSFSVKLGNTDLTGMPETIPASIFDNDSTYLRIWFNDGFNGLQQLSPDRQLVSVPYAFRAKSAESVIAGAIGNEQINKKEVQARIQACDTGKTIESINDDGSVNCIPSNEYTAGDGLVLSGGNDFSIDKDTMTKIDSASAKSISAKGGLESVLVDDIQTLQIDTATMSKINQTGDIDDVKAGSGLTGGGSSGGVTLSVDPTQVQSRVNSICSGTQKMRGIEQNGNPICANDSDTTIPNTDKLASLNCSLGQVAKVVLGKGENHSWECSNDNYSVNTDALESLKCASGQIAKYSNNKWVCSSDITNTGDITEVSTASDSGLNGGGLSGALALSIDSKKVSMRARAFTTSGTTGEFYSQVMPSFGFVMTIDVVEELGYDHYRCISQNSSTVHCSGMLGSTPSTKQAVVVIGGIKTLYSTINYDIRAARDKDTGIMRLGLYKKGAVAMTYQIAGGQ